jgi:hypothetical protein
MAAHIFDKMKPMKLKMAAQEASEQADNSSASIIEGKTLAPISAHFHELDRQ